MGEGRPRHWDHARYGADEEKSIMEDRRRAGIRLMAGEKVFITRSPKEGEAEGKIQEAIILEFNDQTGDALVGFEDESGKTATRTFGRKEIEDLNPEGSRNE